VVDDAGVDQVAKAFVVLEPAASRLALAVGGHIAARHLV
jgi:hypothetical protein